MSDPPGMIWLQWHDNPEPTWEREKIHDDDVEYVFAESYDALRARIEELERELAIIEKPTGILEMQRMLDEATDRIEELEESLDLDFKERDKNLARIEELEKKLRTPVECPQCGLGMGAYSTAILAGHYITHNQIKAAWDEAHRDPPRVWDIFAELGIKRCGCNGALVPCDRCTPTHYKECPTCNGDEFVIGEDDGMAQGEA